MRRLADPSPRFLAIGIGVFGLLTVLALILSVRVSATQSADRAGREAVKTSLCEFYDYQRSGPAPSTPRGRDLVARANAAYKRLGCS
jgi:hypothetical protein